MNLALGLNALRDDADDDDDIDRGADDEAVTGPPAAVAGELEFASDEWNGICCESESNRGDGNLIFG